MKIAGLLGLVAAAVMTMAAAGGTGRKQDNKVIRVTRNVGAREGFRRHWQAWRAAFERDNPGGTMQLVDWGDGDVTAQYRRRAASNDLPEVVQLFAPAKPLADAGYLQAVPDGFFEKFGLPLPPRGYQPDPPRKIGPDTWEDRGGRLTAGSSCSTTQATRTRWPT